MFHGDGMIQGVALARCMHQPAPTASIAGMRRGRLSESGSVKNEREREGEREKRGREDKPRQLNKRTKIDKQRDQDRKGER